MLKKSYPIKKKFLHFFTGLSEFYISRRFTLEKKITEVKPGVRVIFIYYDGKCDNFFTFLSKIHNMIYSLNFHSS